MIGTTEYQRLERTLRYIRSHPPYPGKEQTIGDCLEDLDERRHCGRITVSEWLELRSILLASESDQAGR